MELFCRISWMINWPHAVNAFDRCFFPAVEFAPRPPLEPFISSMLLKPWLCRIWRETSRSFGRSPPSILYRGLKSWLIIRITRMTRTNNCLVKNNKEVMDTSFLLACIEVYRFFHFLLVYNTHREQDACKVLKLNHRYLGYRDIFRQLD